MFTYLEATSSAETQHDVTIVGAGPTGLALAATLQRFGHSPLVLDRQEAGANTSRAAVVHARTLEVLEPLGIVSQMLREGLRVPVFRVRDEDRVLMEVSFAYLDTAYPFALMYPQNRTEKLLLDSFLSAGGAVSRPCEVVELESTNLGATVTYRQADRNFKARSRWVVGCDGAHSAVRELAGIGFEGGTYDEIFILADVEMEWKLSREEVSLFLSSDGLVVVAPLPDNRFRIVATVATAEEHPSLQVFQKVIEDRCPEAGVIVNTIWTSRFHVSHRVVGEMKRGPVILAGDAAHVHSPAGGQGMNTGIQDAVSLAHALHEAIQAADEAPLHRWAEKRLQVARSVVRLTDRMTRLATMQSPYGRLLRNAVLDVAGHIPAIQTLIAEQLSELNYR